MRLKLIELQVKQYLNPLELIVSGAREMLITEKDGIKDGKAVQGTGSGAREILKDGTKDETKDETKRKHETKDAIKDGTKDKTKHETKDETKDKTKHETKDGITGVGKCEPRFATFLR